MNAKNDESGGLFKTVINTSGIKDVNFHIDHLGIEETTKDKNPVHPHATNYNIHFITKGSLYFSYNNQTIKLGKIPVAE